MAARRLQKGEKPPDGLRERVLKLAAMKARPTNREIIKDIERRFEVTIVDRTVRRYCHEAGLPTSSRRMPKAAEPVSQAWRDKHVAEMVFFGQRFRDLVRVPPPHELVTMTPEECKGAMWRGWPAGAVDVGSGYIPVPVSPAAPEERAVAAEWSFLWYDARKHSLFPAFQQHLSGHTCWAALSDIERAFTAYGEACRQAYQAVLREVRSRLPDIPDGDARAATQSLLMHGLYRKTSGLDLGFSYEPEKVARQGQVGWQLHFGGRPTRLVDDPAELAPLAAIHQELRLAPPYETELNILAEADRRVKEAMEKFRGALTPDALLRKLVLNGHCDWCP